MRKFIIATLAIASFATLSAPTLAQNGQGIWHPHCYNVEGLFGPTTACY
jgi:hypothetical protein